MTPDEATLLTAYSRNVLLNVLILLVTTVFYSFSIILMATAATLLLRRTPYSRATVVHFSMILALFSVATFEWITLIIENTILIRIGLIGITSDIPIVEQFEKANSKIGWIVAFQIWPENINFFFADAIVVSRVLILFPENKIAKRSCLCLLLISFGLSLTSCIMFALHYAEYIMSTRTSPFSIAAWTSSLLTNIVATGWISILAREHHRSVSTAKHKSSHIQQILHAIIESGAAFIVLQIAVVILACIDTPPYTPQDICKRALIHSAIIIAAMYPCLVVIAVNRQYSLANDSDCGDVSTLQAADQSTQPSRTSSLLYIGPAPSGEREDKFELGQIWRPHHGDNIYGAPPSPTH